MPFGNEAALHNFVQSIEGSTTPLEFVLIQLIDVDQRNLEAQQRLAIKNTLKAAGAIGKPCT